MPKAKAEKAEPQSASKAAVKEEKVKRERKTYELPGQTKETPIEVTYRPESNGGPWLLRLLPGPLSLLHMQTDSLRKFYTSLHEQKPGSIMAQRWYA